MSGRSAVAALGVAMLLVACAPREVIHHLRGATMGTTYNVKFSAPDDAAVLAGAKARIDEVLEEVNDRFSTWLPESTISRFNAHSSTEPFQADADFVDVLRLALRIAEWTEGAYDPTILPLAEAYGFGPVSEHREPDPAELAAARARVGWEKLEILEGDRVRKLDPGVEIDLNSIAKGRGVDRVAAALDQLGLDHHMVEIGGEVVCGGEKGPGRPWQIGIEQPDRSTGEPVRKVVELRDRAMATSGDYRNYFESDGRRIHHVLDARTGKNAENGVIEVSVLAPDCTLADGLATALMIVGPDRASDLLARPELAGVEALFLVREVDGSLTERTIPAR